MRNSVREIVPVSLIDQLTPEELALHHVILDIADKSIAHCVDGSEENITYVLVGPPKGRSVPLALNVLTTTISHHNILNIEAFEALAERLENLARVECDALARSVMDSLESMSLSEIREFGPLETTIKEGKSSVEKYGGRARRLKK